MHTNTLTDTTILSNDELQRILSMVPDIEVDTYGELEHVKDYEIEFGTFEEYVITTTVVVKTYLGKSLAFDWDLPEEVEVIGQDVKVLNTILHIAEEQRQLAPFQVEMIELMLKIKITVE